VLKLVKGCWTINTNNNTTNNITYRTTTTNNNYDTNTNTWIDNEFCLIYPCVCIEWNLQNEQLNICRLDNDPYICTLIGLKKMLNVESVERASYIAKSDKVNFHISSIWQLICIKCCVTRESGRGERILLFDILVVVLQCQTPIELPYFLNNARTWIYAKNDEYCEKRKICVIHSLHGAHLKCVLTAQVCVWNWLIVVFYEPKMKQGKYLLSLRGAPKTKAIYDLNLLAKWKHIIALLAKILSLVNRFLMQNLLKVITPLIRFFRAPLNCYHSHPVFHLYLK